MRGGLLGVRLVGASENYVAFAGQSTEIIQIYLSRRVAAGRINMKHVDIYTDGACSGNPGPGGFGAVLVYNGREKELSGGEAQTTNNRMELMAVITALEALREPCDVTLTTDSKYVSDGITLGWAESWRARGWKKSDGKPAMNPELWERLLGLLKTHSVKFVWVKGHAGHPYNERCDSLAVNYCKSNFLQ